MLSSMSKYQLVRVVFCLFILASCSSIKKTAMEVTASAMYESADKIKAENNLENFEKGLLGTIYFMEGMTQIIPENPELLVSLIKAYVGYAFIVHETSYLDEYLSKTELVSQKKVLATYTKALKYGLKFLHTQGVSLDDLKSNINSERGIVGFLEEKLSKSKLQLEGVLYTAQSMASLMNYQKTSLSLMAYLPIAKGMFDWTCKVSPHLGDGICDLFYGAYYSSRPIQLGGDPALGRKYFEDLIQRSPYNWLARSSFIQFHIIPLREKNLYVAQMKALEQAVEQNEDDLIWSPKGYKEPQIFANEQIRLYQAVAIKRFKLIKDHEKELFQWSLYYWWA